MRETKGKEIRMFTQYLESIESVAIYPLVSLVLFIVLFTGAAIWALKADSTYIRHMERMPLDGEKGES
ncbi:MAG: hypothetical protein ACM3Q4_15080 [Acidobacteriota bacterium]